LSYDSLFVADTVLSSNVIHFIAKNSKYDNYRWKIGTDDSVFTAKEVGLRFNGVFGDIPIKLIVHSKPDTSCFPNDDGIDSIEKVITVVPWRGGSALIGDYIGCNLDTPKDSFTINIRYKDVYESGHIVDHIYYVNNLNKGCQEPAGEDSSFTSNRYIIGYRHIKVLGEIMVGIGCRAPVGYLNLDKSHENIRINYIMDRDTGKHYEFVGRKLW
jgi:hypothetical protein